MIYYKAEFGDIREVTVVRETDSLVVFSDGRRARKETENTWYAPTRDEAKRLMLEAYSEELEKFSEWFNQALKKLEDARNA